MNNYLKHIHGISIISINLIPSIALRKATVRYMLYNVPGKFQGRISFGSVNRKPAFQLSTDDAVAEAILYPSSLFTLT